MADEIDFIFIFYFRIIRVWSWKLDPDNFGQFMKNDLKTKRPVIIKSNTGV